MRQNVSLKPYNTFGLTAFAERFAEGDSIEGLLDLLEKEQPALILGGGSNVLLTQNIHGLVIKNNFKEKTIVAETEDTVQVRFGAGENWHECVLWCLEQGYGGIENLSLIPGTIGAAPMQNIGAYGVELQQVFVELEAVHLQEKEVRTFDNKECMFGYRDSVFKGEFKGQYFIVSVTLQLTKHSHKLDISYGAIQQTLEQAGVQTPDIKAISNAVIRIRSGKLPDPAKIGNAGSFFKNPVMAKSQFEVIQMKHPDIICYDLPEEHVKVPAGWLIEQCGWKGKRIGNTGTHINQALVLVNHGNATGQEILQTAYQIQDAVHDKFKILLTPEVNVV